MSERLLLAPHASSVSRARHWIISLARRLHAGDVAEQTLELLLSEVLTNAIVHTGTQEPIAVSAQVRSTTIRLSVTDPTAALPVVRPTSPGRPGGNGMRIVDSLASAWGVDLHPGAGKTVWFEAAIENRAKATTTIGSADLGYVRPAADGLLQTCSRRRSDRGETSSNDSPITGPRAVAPAWRD